MPRPAFFVVVASFLVLHSFVMTAYFVAQFPKDWVPNWCGKEGCTVVGWLSATSGWVGFIAAAGTAVLILCQLREQRKLTAFALGDGEPELEIVDPANTKDHAYLALVNYNRRPVVFNRVRVFCEDMSTPPRLVAIVGATATDWREMMDAGRHVLDDRGMLIIAPGPRGWKNRQDRPLEFRFTLVTDTDTHEFVAADYLGSVVLEVETYHPPDKSNVLTHRLNFRRVQLFASKIRPPIDSPRR